MDTRSLARSFFTVAVLSLSPLGLAQSTWYVSSSGVAPGTGDQSDPFVSIQQAIDEPTTLDGDTLLVEPGFYAENVDFAGKTLELRSIQGPGVTTIDGSAGDTSVVSAKSGEGPGALIEGFTLTGGTGTKAVVQDARGGGVYCVASELTVRDCVVVDNNALLGGGLFVANGTLTVVDSVVDSNLTGAGLFGIAATIALDGSTVSKNSQLGSIFGPASGISLVACATTIADCQIFQNGRFDVWSFDQGGGLYAAGGSLLIQDSSIHENLNEFRGAGLAVADCLVTIERCTIRDNRSLDYFWGGGLYVHSVGAPDVTVRDTVFAGNFGGGGGGAYIGGGIAVFESCRFNENEVWAPAPYIERGAGGALHVTDQALASVDNCVFFGNLSGGKDLFLGGQGGAVYGAVTLTHCTLIANQADWPGGAATQPEGGGTWGAQLESCIVWQNAPDNLDATSTASFSDIEDGWAGEGNIALDPLFWNPLAQDYHLSGDSPCIGAGAAFSDMGAFPFDPAYCGLGCTADIGTRICTPGIPNSTGAPGVMTVTGSETVADDDLTLWALDLPATSNIGYFIMGTGTNTFVPLGSVGPICVAPGLKRYLPPVNNTTQLGGGFSRDVGTTGPDSGQITAGSTWGFQAWYRDSGGGSNLTDAVSVTFL